MRSCIVYIGAIGNTRLQYSISFPHCQNGNQHRRCMLEMSRLTFQWHGLGLPRTGRRRQYHQH